MSVVLHEVAHGYVALYFGDRTAYYAGRLSLNPIKHLDWFSSILLPAILILTSFPFPFAAAKPVPVNLNNVRSGRWPRIAIALAGIATNAILAIVFTCIARLSVGFVDQFATSLMLLVVYVNLSLTVFNLFPIPPLDGSRVLVALLPPRFYTVERFLDSYGFVILIVVMFGVNFFGIDIIGYPVRYIFTLLTGLTI